MTRTNVMAAMAGLLWALAVPAVGFAQTNLVSTQMRPVDEAEKVRNVILKGMPDAVNFIPEDGNAYFTRMRAELAAAQGKVHATIALDGELSPVNEIGGLSDLDDLARRLGSTREFSASALQLGKLGGANQRFIPLMTNTFQMAANKQALKYLPAGADINALTYTQLRDWAKAMKDATGEAKLGFPAGPRGLWWRYFQASFYPSHTGGIVRTFRNADAEKAWTDFREMWNDHTARLLSALVDRPNDFVTFPAPAGAKGRGYMPVMVGMAIPKNAPDRAAAERLIDHMTKPATQALLLKEIGFFPVVKSDLSGLSAGVQLAAQGMAATLSAKDGRASQLPVHLGAKGGEFNKIFVDTFTRIVLRNEDVKKVLAEQGNLLDALIKEAKAPCWAPDASSGTSPCPVQ